jgi:fructose-1,6-bisphosphatase/inositol monophosphatase family enzyme
VTLAREHGRAQSFVTALRPALRQAAAIARALEGRVSNRPKSGEESAVKAALTIADTASQEALLVRLIERFPSVELDAEEDTPSVARFPSRGDGLVVIDPIDGTLHCYLDGEGAYSILVGLASAGRFEAALVALPRENLFFDAVSGVGARVATAGSTHRPPRPSPGARGVLVSHGVPVAVTRALEANGYDVARASGGAVSVAPLVPGMCAGLRIGKAAAGVSRRGRIGLLVAREAGLLVRGADDLPFPEEIDAPAPVLRVAAREEDMAALGDALSRARR